MKEKHYRITVAQPDDIDELSDIFIEHISLNRSYISHGELQMGVGRASITEEGTVVVGLKEDGRAKWLKYISEKIALSREKEPQAVVFKALSEEGVIVGFCVADIEEDGDRPFGMVCDVLVKEAFRGNGLGSMLLDKAVGWLGENGIEDIYLESGLHNHSAHDFFRKRGFREMSEIFKLF